jgi:hypothetical protein
MPEKQSQLSVAREEFNQYVQKSLEGAVALRDQLKLQAQLGTEEAKAHWADLEKYLDTLGHDLTHAASDFGDRLVGLVRRAAPKRAAKPAVKKVAKKAVKKVKKVAQKAASKGSRGKAPKKRSRR